MAAGREGSSDSLYLFPYLVSVYITALVLRPVLISKILVVGGVIFPGALLVFPLSFICNDIFSEVYGFERSRNIVWAGLFCQVLASVAIVTVGFLPAPSIWNHQSAFDQILGQSPRIAAASLVAYFLGELTNSVVLSKLKYSQKGKGGFRQGYRFVVSTIAGEFVDSSIFISFAFVGMYEPKQIAAMIVSTWVLKSSYEFVLLPMSLRITQRVKRLENIDVIDDPKNTNYSFFKLASNN